MLYLFQSKQVGTVREVSAVLGKSEDPIHRWLFQYKKGGLENLLKKDLGLGNVKTVGFCFTTSIENKSAKKY